MTNQEQLKFKIKPKIWMENILENIMPSNTKECNTCLLFLSKCYFNHNRSICKDCLKLKNSNDYMTRKYTIIRCDCGEDVTGGNLYQHKKTKKHRRRMGIN